MTDCQTCEAILSEEQPLKCRILKMRKYIIGFLIGAVVVYVIIRRGKNGK